MSSNDTRVLPLRTSSTENCWSCRLLSGTGLVAAGGYVYLKARSTLRRGGPTSIGTVAQIVFALSLVSGGITIIVDPVGKAERSGD